MNCHRSGIAVLGTLLLSACSGTLEYRERPARYGPVYSANSYSAYDEGYRRGLIDGEWAGYRDLGKPYRRDFWDDGRYRRGSEGYRVQYGSRIVYADGYRAGYESGYRERRARGRGRSRP